MMDLVDKIQLYLPQYLSSSEKKKLEEELDKFPTDGTKDTIYTTALNGCDYLLQGDTISDVNYINFPDTTVNDAPVMILSNTCDMSLSNKRLYGSNIMYAPIIDLSKFEKKLLYVYDKGRVDNLISDIRKQRISQILYIPKGSNMQYEGIVFFDRAISMPLTASTVKYMCGKRMTTLSNFGFYLLLLKISMHFTRIQERIDRTTGKDL